jgi:hypothetical protein
MPRNPMPTQPLDVLRILSLSLRIGHPYLTFRYRIIHACKAGCCLVSLVPCWLGTR